MRRGPALAVLGAVDFEAEIAGRANVAVLALGEAPTGADVVSWISAPADPVRYGHDLYANLRTARLQRREADRRAGPAAGAAGKRERPSVSRRGGRGRDRGRDMSKDKWRAAGSTDPTSGRWSRRSPSPSCPGSKPPGAPPGLDVGCGTGALVDCILAYAAPRSVKGIDASEGFLATAVESIPRSAL
jgi:hypothetical protein